MDFIQGFDRNQLQMLSFNEFVKADSWARVVDLFVDILPMKKLGFKEEHAKQGLPPYSCSDLLKLYLYGYRMQLRSSRKLAHACQVNLEVIWLIKAFKQAFRYFVVLLKEMNHHRWTNHRYRFL